ncbi:hypothetical protein GN958_ATG21485 [Phytophthora infestans]|uniref:RxLR effector protein n=1 Tax=Phytophthora infestans TaxID=4787 RepID=A0A8S9TLH4_PHYIN|nr:hypothetical protein GN958_ATG21485 [Phytophthora infestans]
MDSSERANPISKFLSKINDKVLVPLKIEWWLELGKPVDDLKKKLGMAGLTGNALVRHKNYPRLVRYARKLEENTIWTLVHKDVSTYYWWNRVGLNRMVPDTEGMTTNELKAQLYRIKDTKEFQSYKRYAIAFDDYIIGLFGSGYNRPTKFFDENTTPLEKMARAKIWRETNRRKSDVKEFFNLERASEDQLRLNKYYALYFRYL